MHKLHQRKRSGSVIKLRILSIIQKSVAGDPHGKSVTFGTNLQQSDLLIAGLNTTLIINLVSFTQFPATNIGKNVHSQKILANGWSVRKQTKQIVIKFFGNQFQWTMLSMLSSMVFETLLASAPTVGFHQVIAYVRVNYSSTQQLSK